MELQQLRTKTVIAMTLLVLSGRPGPPCLLEVIDVTEDSVTLSWLSPEKDGGARILRYVVELLDYSRAEGWIKVRVRF